MEKEDFDEDRKLKDENRKYVLSYLLSQCKDFKEEMCDLEYLAKELGERDATISMILFTRKYHCELAGEGIEYCCRAQQNEYFENCHSRKEGLGSPSKPVSRSASAR
jgi:hypothetical protein